MKADDALAEVEAELTRATGIFGPFASAHEGIAVIREEYLELEEAVFTNMGHHARKEAIQLAAMAVRFLVDRY